MGLNEVYTVIRGSILMMNPLPSMAQAFALLVQEEKQREFKPHSQMFAGNSSMNSSMNVGSSSSSGGKLASTNTGSSSSSGGRMFRTNYSSNNYPANNRSRPFCEHCRRPGHTVDKCYKIHGYPNQGNTSSGQNFNQQRCNNAQNQRAPVNYNANHRYAKGKGVAANVFADPNMGETDEPHPTCNANLTSEQYSQLINLLQHFQLGKSGDANFEEQITCGAANFAEIALCDPVRSSTSPSPLSPRFLPSEPTPPIRKSTRTHKPPVYLKDYLYTGHQPTQTSLHASFSNHHHIASALLYLDSQSLILSVSHDCEPSSFNEAAMNPAWQAAMTQELTALHDNDTWDLMYLPVGKKAIRCR
ncbi:hypothetical protein KY290_031577 [Solanum tuberosum]|uniref:Uncharacterized protein n=1 Tax=Solanum tuberosum TaxID=4113 RepID=A0ABQ7UBD3_SOLTU|nr:hypothetical protein KY290_031577 [Solanum tuberosum]